MSRAIFMSERSDERADYEYDRRREERAEEQAEMFTKPLSPDVFTLLRLFENYRGIDRPQDWFDLKQRYHGQLEDPASRECWTAARLNRVLDEAEDAGLIEYSDKWMITTKGLEARKAETVRRMKA
ncbi:hypothetical protein [Marinobacter nauticus]|uniref:hypothetical protein n=1 Tax=Marinobacter nauticus TaxID=2743 RepID=UPI001C997B2B|nr:hypothetical protein [Marinobacter nauticus]MBY5961936.1 hypothetical protein [Marinobacter nauticus]